MDARAAKRHKRQTERAKAKIRTSEPDLRTAEEVKAAREASRPTADKASAPSFRGPQSRSGGTGSTAPSKARTDA